MFVDLIVWIVKNLFINIFIYYTFLRIKNYKKISFIRILMIIIVSLITTIVYCFFKNYVDQLTAVIVMYLIQNVFLRIFLKDRNQLIITTNVVANALVYSIFALSTILEFFISSIFNIQNIIINLILILTIEGCILVLLFKVKRFNKGLSFLKSTEDNENLDIIMINVGVVAIFTYILFGNNDKKLTKSIFVPFVLLGITILVMIQKTFTLYYKQKLLEKNLADYKNDIAERDAKIKQLSDEKFEISKLNHEFYNRQKSLELKVKEFVSNANFNTETASEIDVMEQINNLSKEYSSKHQKIKNPSKLPLTEITEIDDMFKYMQSECKENNINFELQINGNIHHMVNNFIEQSKLVTLIGDHIRDAIIAVKSSNNSYRSIIAMLGIKDNTYEFCVYDTGVEFEIETLLKLGLEPITTHKDEGGTGIGFITTFETLKETKASLIIEEKHQIIDNDYTKAVIIRFDGKHEYKIRSYRAKEIKQKIKDRDIIVENI